MPQLNTRTPLRGLLVFVCLLFAVASTSTASSASASASSSATALATLSADRWEPDTLASIDLKVFQLALKAARCAVKSGAVGGVQTLTVIDYSRPSTEQRLWVFDLPHRELLFNELVAHGQGTGEELARTFSNAPGTHASSLGLFTTQDTYVGRNGYSLRLEGLDAGFNDRARERAIVMHGAPYVSEAFAKQHGRLGRSWGCPALSEGVAREVIDRVKGSGLVFAYYPDAEWLRTSQFFACE